MPLDSSGHPDIHACSQNEAFMLVLKMRGSDLNESVVWKADCGFQNIDTHTCNRVSLMTVNENPGPQG